MSNIQITIENTIPQIVQFRGHTFNLAFFSRLNLYRGAYSVELTADMIDGSSITLYQEKNLSYEAKYSAIASAEKVQEEFNKAFIPSLSDAEKT